MRSEDFRTSLVVFGDGVQNVGDENFKASSGMKVEGASQPRCDLTTLLTTSVCVDPLCARPRSD